MNIIVMDKKNDFFSVRLDEVLPTLFERMNDNRGKMRRHSSIDRNIEPEKELE